MTASIGQPAAHHLVSVVLCGSTLMDTYQALQLDFGNRICLSADFESGLQAAESLSPSVLMADEESMRQVDLSSIRVRLAFHPTVRILAWADGNAEEFIKELLRAGIAGFVEKGASADTVREALLHVHRGEIWAPRKLVSEALRGMVSVVDDPRFTRRELEILRRIAAGEDNRHIAESLFITRETVRWHLRSAYAKLGVHDRSLAAELLRNPA